MLLKLLALFTIVPLVELALLIPLGMHIGLWPTIGLVVATALLGAVLGKLEGKRAWGRIKQDLREGKMPGDSLLDGLAVLVAGIFLVTPGVLTDIVAMILLIPPARKPIRAYARKRFKKMLKSERVNVMSQGPGTPFAAASPAGEDRDEDADDGGPRRYQPTPFDRQDDVIDVTPGDGEDEDAETVRSSHHEHVSS